QVLLGGPVLVMIAAAGVDQILAVARESEILQLLAVIVRVGRDRPRLERGAVRDPNPSRALLEGRPGHTLTRRRGDQLARKSEPEHLLDGEHPRGAGRALRSDRRGKHAQRGNRKRDADGADTHNTPPMMWPC